MGKVALLLPAYNEEAQIQVLINSARSFFAERGIGYKIIVVDDGSSDQTIALVQQINDDHVIILEHKVNQGLGAAMNTGINYFLDNPALAEILVAMDADNTHDPSLIADMIPLIDTGTDLVIASRYQKGAKVIGLSLFRVLLSYGASIFFRILHPISGVKDYSCGYRAYSRRALNKLKEKYGVNIISESGFSCMVEILIKLKKLYTSSKPIGLRVSELPLVLRYDKKVGASKIKILITIWRTIKIGFANLLKSG